MNSNKRTCAEAVDALFSEGGPYFSTDGNPRLWGHDFIHTFLETELNTSHAEEVVGVYQAILLNDPRVDKRQRPWADMRLPVTVDTIRSEVIPAVRRFVQDITTSRGLTSRPALSDAEITEHYVKAKTLARLIYDKFGRDLGNIPVDEIKAMPFAEFQGLVKEVDHMYQGTPWPESLNLRQRRGDRKANNSGIVLE